MIALITDKVIYEENSSITFSDVMPFFFFVRAGGISLKFIYKKKMCI